MIDSSSDRCMARLHEVEAIDYFLAKELAGDSELMFHIVLALNWAVRQGHSCLDLSGIAERLLWHDPENDKPGYQFPTQAEITAELEQHPLLPNENGQLVYEQGRLYLRRYWQMESELAVAIRERVLFSPLPQEQLDLARDTIGKLFPDFPLNQRSSMDLFPETDWQAVAVINALGRRLSIISGGPGTGKTFTVTRLLAMLQTLADNELHIAMAAPTGKAKQRLQESIVKAKGQLADAGFDSTTLEAIPIEAQTIHRLLGVRPDSTQPRYHQRNLLPVDLLLIDEVSMVDLSMMTWIIRALPEQATLILVGDANQLPSIGVGSVLSDLVIDPHPGYSEQSTKLIQQLSGYQVPLADVDSGDHISFLYKSHRFDGKGEIGQLANEVINLKADQSWQRLQNFQLETFDFDHSLAELSYVPLEQFEAWLEWAVANYYQPLSVAADLESAFRQLSRFRLLAPTRVGEWGVETLNQRIEELLGITNPVIKPGHHYHGRPIMITRNHHGLRIYNGDIGLIWQDESGKLTAKFQQDEEIRTINLGLLPEVETVYAMTIHKTQGSEFGHVAMLVTEQASRLLSSELLYTGITRAINHCTIASAEAEWKSGVSQSTKRFSGLS